MRFFANAQNDCNLRRFLWGGGLVAAKPPPSPLPIILKHCHSERNEVE